MGMKAAAASGPASSDAQTEWGLAGLPRRPRSSTTQRAQAMTRRLSRTAAGHASAAAAARVQGQQQRGCRQLCRPTWCPLCNGCTTSAPRPAMTSQACHQGGGACRGTRSATSLSERGKLRRRCRRMAGVPRWGATGGSGSRVGAAVPPQRHHRPQSAGAQRLRRWVDGGAAPQCTQASVPVHAGAVATGATAVALARDRRCVSRATATLVRRQSCAARSNAQQGGRPTDSHPTAPVAAAPTLPGASHRLAQVAPPWQAPHHQRHVQHEPPTPRRSVSCGLPNHASPSPCPTTPTTCPTSSRMGTLRPRPQASVAPRRQHRGFRTALWTRAPAHVQEGALQRWRHGSAPQVRTALDLATRPSPAAPPPSVSRQYPRTWVQPAVRATQRRPWTCSCVTEAKNHAQGETMSLGCR